MRPSALPLLLSLSACAPPVLSLRPAQPGPAPRDYGAVFERWTRVGSIHSFRDMDVTLLIAATLRGPEFQQAYAARYLAMYRVPEGAEKQRFLDEQRQLAEAGVSFFIRTGGHDWKWADLASQKRYWRMVLLDDGGREVEPSKVEPVAVSREPIEQELVGGPLTGPLARFYQVTFPAQREGGEPVLRPGQRVTLRLSGPRGRTDLSWTFKE